MIERFGEVEAGQVLRGVLKDEDVSVSILNYGCITQDWRVPAGRRSVPVVLGFETIEPYVAHARSFGIIAGRVANRTAFGRFSLGGEDYQLECNNGPHHLHGGFRGLGHRLWEIEADGHDCLRLQYHSPDGENGYPGAIDLEVVVSLSGHRLTYEMRGMPDRPTPINLAQHSYYNLGTGDVLGHELSMRADFYTPVDDTLIPTGAIDPVAGTRLDFRTMRPIGVAGQASDIDLNFVLNGGGEPAAVVRHPDGLQLKLWTDQPGLQVFNAPKLDVPVLGHDGRRYGAFGGLCLEPQKFPDGLNQPDFPDLIATPEAPYFQKLVVEIM